MQVSDLQDILKFDFENEERSSVFHTSKLSQYISEEKYHPSVLLGLEQARNFKADAVFFRYLENGRAPIAQIYIYDNISNPRNDEEYAHIHRDIWSASEIPLYFIIDKHQLRVFDGRIPVQVADNGELTISPLQTFSDLNEAIKLYNAELFSTGAFWNDQEASVNFQHDNTINEKLLLSLKYARKYLKAQSTLKESLVDHLLIISILIRYLEENGIDKNGNDLAAKFFEKAVGYSSLVETIENGAFVELLDKLAEHFNGGVFKLADTDKATLCNTDLTSLANLLAGKLNEDQILLWPEYSFRYIPIELISYFYEEFLPKEKNTSKKEDTGAVYTPSYLARLLVDECLPIVGGELKSLIDISCGSGIFLVTAFKRLVQIWRYQNKNNGQLASADANVLKKILYDYIFGVDIDPIAAELTMFSLNLSLCSMLSPEQIWTELRFDDLSKNNIIKCDFFQYLVNSEKKFDLVIGNPPFKEYKEGQFKQIKALLRKGRLDFKVDIPRYQSALMFLEKAMDILKPSKGKLCLILPAGPFLYSQLDPFRRYFLKEYNVTQIIDFTFLSTMLFKANIATIALFAENTNPDEQDVTHIVAKRTGSNKEKIFFEFDYYDFYSVPKEVAQTSDFVWKSNLLGGIRTYGVIEKYKKYPTIKDYLKQKKKISGWYNSEGYIVGDKRQKADYITNSLSVVNNSFTEQGTWETEIEYSEGFNRPRKRILYEPPVLLVKEGIGDKAFPIGLSCNRITFKQGIIGIHSPFSDICELKRLMNYIKNNNNFLRFYIVGESTRAGISKSIHTHLAGDFYNLPYSEQGFSLTANEEIVVADVVKYFFPYFDTVVNPEMDRLVANSQIASVFVDFGTVYCDQLNAIYEKDDQKYKPAGVYEGDSYFIFIIDYTSEERTLQKYVSKVDLDSLLTYTTEDYVVKRIVRKYEDNRIIMIKPKQFRYWMKSVALRDADDTFADITDYYG